MLASKEELELSLKIFEGEFLPYYLSLDEQVAETNRYVSIRSDNRKAYSLEYSKLLQTICGEIDVFAKALCNLGDPSLKPKDLNIQKWGIRLQDLFPAIETEFVRVEGYGELKPWANWRYEYYRDKNDVKRIRLIQGKSTPIWWAAYNKVKHERTMLRPDKSLHFEKANQGNVIRALAALYILESLYLREASAPENIQSHIFVI